ncbi:putative NUDIX hydrolase [Scytonema sp. HK-05]|uniref:NUDIX hydrolase n=1 Tax=Scytonema sp. HK-05 TaxID=1137095 RepID=UPI000936ABA0|nr:NUDIX domain-containing protein [Scytonema sp. HK-05]OKH57692.1 NUDIX hydrolase [Scytonema sp. HK-05]BAY44372.1 putative NUDIX hydrolase [Scytonema sp. HK-05]
MDTDETIFTTNWVTVKKTPRGFDYLERKGKDSVAVFLLRRNDVSPVIYEVLIRQLPLCIDSTEFDGQMKLFPCPITGALDEGESPEEAAIREVYEEAGFSVKVLSLGKYIVGTQTNEICYMYYADVTGIEPDIAQQDGTYHESISKNEWRPFEYLNNCDYSACQIGYFRLRDIFYI